MPLTTLKLDQFRSYDHIELEIPEAGLRIVGPNASGKTTLLEAVLFLATMRSARSSTESDLIRWSSGEEYGVAPFSRLEGTIAEGNERTELVVTLQRDEASASAKKRVAVDGRPRRVLDAVGLLRAVSFTPEDVGLLAGAPANRRRYVDVLLSQIDRGYLRSLSRFGRLLSQRNGLLRGLSRERAAPESTATRSQLAFWDQELVAAGSLTVAHRLLCLRQVERFADRRLVTLSQEPLGIEYQSNVVSEAEWRSPPVLDVDRLADVIARNWTERLESVRADEVRRGLTLLGPQRDDFAVSTNGVDVGVYGSRGQQRLAVVALKLAEADLMEAKAHTPPTVLLDDVFSELDDAHASHLIGALSELGCQLLVTTTDRARLTTPELEALTWLKTDR